jgi:DNA-binding NarL/FixJ family response regulator
MAQVLFLSDDLMFGSRVAHAALMQNVSLQTVLQLEQLPEALQYIDVDRIILDLSCPAFNPAHVMEVVESSDREPRTMAFGSHVHQAKLDAASAAGFDEVVSNGQFNDRLPGLFTQA